MELELQGHVTAAGGGRFTRPSSATMVRFETGMAKALVVVESPAKAKTINKYLGRNYKVIASMGHVRDLPKSKLGVDIGEDFEPVVRGHRRAARRF